MQADQLAASAESHLENVPVKLVEKDKADPFGTAAVIEKIPCCRDGDPGRGLQRKLEGARGDGRESDAPAAAFAGLGKACLVRRLQLPATPLVVVLVIDWPHRVDDPVGGKAEGGRRADLPGGASLPLRVERQFSAGLEQLRPGGLVDGTVHAPSAQQECVCRVDDGIDLLVDNIAQQQLDAPVSSSLAHLHRYISPGE